VKTLRCTLRRCNKPALSTADSLLLRPKRDCRAALSSAYFSRAADRGAAVLAVRDK